MLSIEEIKLLIEKLEKIKGHDFQKLIDDNLKILKNLATVVDINNQDQIDRLDKTKDWYAADLEWRHARKDLLHDQILFDRIVSKIGHFAKSGAAANLCNSLEIGPGYGTFSKCFLAWRLNYFVDIVPHCQTKIKKLFNPKYAAYYKKEIEEMENDAKSFTKQGIIDCLEGMKQRKDREVILKFAQYPIMFIMGKMDPVIDFLKLKEQSTIPSKSFSCILSESGHMGFIEEKNKSQKALKRFIRMAFSKM
jgi:hypothetical protein